MLFNSFEFAVFLPIVFISYWFVFNKTIKQQNILLLVSSYTFYGWWDLKFLALILLSTVTDYLLGIRIAESNNRNARKLFLFLSLSINLGMLFCFKYFNFFIDNFNSAFLIFGTDFNINSLNIILPVGISFYTFQTLSYTIDIYKKKIQPTKDFIAFSAFVSFFPQLVAGPIERAKNLLPQFKRTRVFNYTAGVDGLRQILWGLFKKLVIADNCAIYVNYIFENSSNLSGSTLVLGAIFFTFQIYGDFSGYSDIAIGTARLLGFNLMQNFAFPFFARDIPEFWRRWHISLTTWFRDYVYIPLIRNSRGKLARVRNIFILFLLTGFWHGANWTFIVWGGLNAIYFLPFLLIKTVKSHAGVVSPNSNIPSVKDCLLMFSTFLLNVFGIIFFRAKDLSHATDYISRIFSQSFFEMPYYSGIGLSRGIILIIIIFMLIEWFGRKDLYAIEKYKYLRSRFSRWIFYTFLIVLIGVFMYTSKTDFIYFQF